MKPVVIVSVQHTGTNFTTRLLHEMGLRIGQYQNELVEFNIKPNPWVFYRHHVYNQHPQKHWESFESARLIICPLRHPHINAKSCWKRGHSIDWVAEKWHWLVSLNEKWGDRVFYLDIDGGADNRWLMCQAMADFIGIPEGPRSHADPYIDKWEKQNAFPSTNEQGEFQLTDRDRESLEFAVCFYEENKHKWKILV